MAKSNLFKGLAAVFGFTLSVCAFMSVIAFDRQGDIDNRLGVGRGNVNTQGSAYASEEELRKAENDYEIRTMAEGSVLLRNQNKALPLTGKKVTLFGNASVRPSFHGGSGGPSNTGVDLKTALEEEGFQINKAVYDKIEASPARRKDHDIGEVDPSIYNAADIGDYKDAAIVTICRYGGENNDVDVNDSYGLPELSLHDQEKQMLEFVKAQGFSKVIVLLNTGYAMDAGWIADYADAALWIAFPGQYGMRGVAKMLTGECNPSGRLVDTYATSQLSSPAMRNFGDFKFTDLPKDLFHHEYVVYAEGIYTGYKYYETRYADQVQNLHNATVNKGVYAEGATAWDYAKEMVYPFGYGLSYSTFKTDLSSLDWDTSSHKVTAKAMVENTGSVKAKRTVELYASLPYESGQAQKSAIQLIGFGKTAELEPGAKEEVVITVDDYLFATYDENAVNGADSTKKGCYVFDPGDYYFAIGEDAHDALNNVLASQGVGGLFDQDGNPVYGKASLTKKINLASLDNVSHAKNATTGAVVSNNFAEVDINKLIPGAVTYMTRDDWNTYPDAITGLKADDDASGLIRKHMTARSSLYVKPDDAPDYKSFKFNQENGINFIQMKGVDFNDNDKWDAFIDQLTTGELGQFVGEKMQNEAITSVNYPKNVSGDGPDGLQSGGILHPSQTLAAATYNLDLLAERGKFLAEDAIYSGYGMVYGGGCNLHRTPYAGRNFEYYSEESIISYYCGRAQGKAMTDGGLLGAFKHFLGNDQETNRHGVATFMTEQTLRQGDARGFEGALTDGAALANMGAYNRLGVYPTNAYKNLMTDLLRTEWGFKGISITDSSKDASSYIFTADAITAGTTLFNNDMDRGTEAKQLITKARDGYVWQSLRTQAKHFFYAYLHSNVTWGLTENTVVTNELSWWKIAINALDMSLISLTALSLAGYALFFIIEKKKEAR